MCKRCRKRCRKRIPPFVQGHIGEVWIFLVFPKLHPPLGGSTQKSILSFPTGIMGCPCQFGWDPSSSLGSKSEQTIKETDRQTGLFYIYMDSSYEKNPSILLDLFFFNVNVNAAGLWTKSVLVFPVARRSRQVLERWELLLLWGGTVCLGKPEGLSAYLTWSS